ncbi:MarR family winged helix-turn-helix transcriptional regulator [Pseudogemmobacter sonorensis]|uniref:MarR family winged helix-turn-helix transcriptional regulator n=1 Tax=Pseudogemmobacter sonorensis TaxID=2989681 RepID=UPI0036782211
MAYSIDRLSQLLHDTSRALRRRFDERAAPHGLSSTQFRLLVLVYTGGPMTQRQLAEHLYVEPISVSRLIDRMAAAGWVERITHPEDRRARLIRHTERADAVAGEIMAIAHRICAEALAPLTEDQRRMLETGLASVLETLSGPDREAARGI